MHNEKPKKTQKKDGVFNRKRTFLLIRSFSTVARGQKSSHEKLAKFSGVNGKVLM